MKGFRRSQNNIIAKFDDGEAPILANLIEQFINMLEDLYPAATNSGEQTGLGSPDQLTDNQSDQNLSRDCVQNFTKPMNQVEPNDEVDPFDDPFVAWEAEFSQEDYDENLYCQDPVILRLFPDAYTHDPKASAEFRRLTQSSQRLAKISDAYLVLADLGATEGKCLFPESHFLPWLKTLTNLRLALGSRLGIVDASSALELNKISDDDPRWNGVILYNWLGWVQETLLMLDEG